MATLAKMVALSALRNLNCATACKKYFQTETLPMVLNACLSQHHQVIIVWNLSKLVEVPYLPEEQIHVYSN